MTPGWGLAALATLGGCAIGVAAGVRLAARLAAARERPASPPTPGAARGEVREEAARAGDEIRPSHLRRDERVRAEVREALAERELLATALRDARDAALGDEAIFWRWLPHRDVLVPAAWSTVDAIRPQFFRAREWAPLAQWTAESRLPQREAEDGVVRFTAVPVVRDDHLLGVLSISRETGLGPVVDEDHDWLERQGRYLATLLDLCAVRRELGRHMRQSQALFAAVRQIHVHRTPDSLARAICETSMDVSSAGWAALVRWYAGTGSGEVVHSTAGMGVEAPFPVSGDSLVASVCHEALPIVLEDGSARHPDAAVFASGERLAGVGSLAIVPLFQGEVPIGAIVIAAADPGAITHEESDHLTLLGAAASTSLAIVWEIEEVSRRAMTDPLTGLANRRHFDDQLHRVLSETDRFGGAASLILVDIDHFKRVNDTFGHDAGDAVLRAVAKILADGVRTVDVCARFGGEEVALLLPQTSLSGATELAERLRRSIEGRTVRHGTEEISVTASFGVASYPECARSRDAFFPAADKSLYDAKREGRNRVKSAMIIPSGSRT